MTAKPGDQEKLNIINSWGKNEIFSFLVHCYQHLPSPQNCDFYEAKPYSSVQFRKPLGALNLGSFIEELEDRIQLQSGKKVRCALLTFKAPNDPSGNFTFLCF
jgi:hypothetical protein